VAQGSNAPVTRSFASLTSMLVCMTAAWQEGETFTPLPPERLGEGPQIRNCAIADFAAIACLGRW
jgi:hypothetical protein